MWIVYMSVALLAAWSARLLFKAYLNGLLNGRIAYGYRGWLVGVGGCALLFSFATIFASRTVYELIPWLGAFLIWPIFILTLDGGYRAVRLATFEEAGDAGTKTDTPGKREN